MKEKEGYVGFPPLLGTDEMVNALVHDPPDHRWRVVRDLFRIGDPQVGEELIAKLQPQLLEVQDFRIKYRITVALQALHYKGRTEDYVLVKGKGAFRADELESWGTDDKGSRLPRPGT